MNLFRRKPEQPVREEHAARSHKRPAGWESNLTGEEPDYSIPVIFVGQSPELFRYWEDLFATYGEGRYQLTSTTTEQALRSRISPQYAQVFLVEATVEWRGQRVIGASPVVTFSSGFLQSLRECGPVVGLLDVDRSLPNKDASVLDQAGFDLYALYQESDISWLIQELDKAPMVLEMSTPADEEDNPGWEAPRSSGNSGRREASLLAPHGLNSPRPATRTGTDAPAHFWDASELVDSEFLSGASPFQNTRPGGRPVAERQVDEASTFPRHPGPVAGSRPALPRPSSGPTAGMSPRPAAESSALPPVPPMDTERAAREFPVPAQPPVSPEVQFSSRSRTALVQTRGLLGFWGPDPADQRYLAALNLGLCLRERGLPTLVGEFCRPEGKLALHMGLEEEERSLLQTASHVGEFLAASLSEHYIPFFERHLFHGLPPPSGSEPLIFFTSAAPFQEVELMSAQVTDLLPPLLKRLGHWNYRLAIIGSALSDPLHLETLQNSDRLVLCLTPDPHGLELADLLVPRVLQAVGLTEANVDVLLLQYDRALAGLAGQAQAGEPAQIQQLRKQYARALEARMDQVRGYLKRWGLANSLIGCLPDALPLLEQLGKSCQNKHKTVLNFSEGQKSPYGQAIMQIADQWIAIPASTGKTARWGRR